MGHRSEAEREYVAAVSVEPGIPLFWFSLANLYKDEGRISETIYAQRQAIQLSTMPQPFERLKLARLYLEHNNPKLPCRHSMKWCAALPLTFLPQREDAASVLS